MSMVDPSCREMIANNVSFPLPFLTKVDDFELSCLKISARYGEEEECRVTVDPHKGTGPKTRPEFFQLLYLFGQFYLQCYPEKTAAFLEYLSFLTKYGIVYTVQLLVKLDNQIRRYFVQHPTLNWDVTTPLEYKDSVPMLT